LKYAILVFAELVSSNRTLKMSQSKYEQELILLEQLNLELKGVVQNVYDISKTACYFLIKELIRKYGSSTIKELVQIEEFKWIVPDGLIDTNLDLDKVRNLFKMSINLSNENLIKPFKDLIIRPDIMKDSFLPTMQQDVTFDIQTALLQARGHDNPKFYACPNGHPYVLFDVSFFWFFNDSRTHNCFYIKCGRPWVIMKCKECNADIGGTSHKLIETNKELNVTDTTLRGYCLTDASTISDNPQTERQLNQPAFHVVRFFLHCALYFACDNDEKAVKTMMVKEQISPKDFFLQHLNKDLFLIGRALDLNQDEVLIILHSILNDIPNLGHSTLNLNVFYKFLQLTLIHHYR
jgi:uncharacterized protein YihD (DUF1040 family)